MGSQVLLNNTNNKDSGSPVCVKDGNHQFGCMECRRTFSRSGRDPSEWRSCFVILEVPDAEPSELNHLLEAEDVKKYYFDIESLVEIKGADLTRDNHLIIFKEELLEASQTRY